MTNDERHTATTTYAAHNNDGWRVRGANAGGVGDNGGGYATTSTSASVQKDGCEYDDERRQRGPAATVKSGCVAVALSATLFVCPLRSSTAATMPSITTVPFSAVPARSVPYRGCVARHRRRVLHGARHWTHAARSRHCCVRHDGFPAKLSRGVCAREKKLRQGELHVEIVRI